MIDIALAVLMQAAGSGTDTTVAVTPGSRLRIQNQGGDIAVKTWDRNQIRIRAQHSARSDVEVDVRGSVVEVTARGRRGLAGMVDYDLTVPAWMALDLGGMYAEITVEGSKAPIKAQTLEGDITVRGGAESVSLSTVNGSIDASGLRGRVELHAVSGDVVVADVQGGELSVESVSGEIDLRRIDVKSVDAQTVSGDIIFEGRLAEGGSYSFVSHSGDVTLGVPETSNATINLASANGEMNTSFSLKTERETRRRHTYRLGNGGATVDVETFNGDLDLIRPNEVKARSAERDDDVKIKVKTKRPGHREDRDEDRDRDRDLDRLETR